MKMWYGKHMYCGDGYFNYLVETNDFYNMIIYDVAGCDWTVGQSTKTQFHYKRLLLVFGCFDGCNPGNWWPQSGSGLANSRSMECKETEASYIRNFQSFKVAVFTGKTLCTGFFGI